MPRISRGCSRCRQRRVKCDEARPVCRRCLARNELCIGYRDESDLIFRHETNKTMDRVQTHNHTESASSTSGSSSSGSQLEDSRTRSTSVGSSPRSHEDAAILRTRVASSIAGRSEPSMAENQAPVYPWLKTTAAPPEAMPTVEDQAISRFFDKYVMYPCNQTSTAGFLEHLPSLFKEVNVEGRWALRYAVQAAAFADSAQGGRTGKGLAERSIQCYGSALAALSRSLSEKGKTPDDYDLMTVVVLDIFETLYMPDAVSRGAHAQGMAHILRLRGHSQFHDPRGWGLFRVAHHRLLKQKQQLAFQLAPTKDSEALLSALNDQLAFVHLENDALNISNICQRGRTLVGRLNEENVSLDELLDLVREMHTLDQAVVTWRSGPEWSFKTLERSEIVGDESIISTFPETVQLHPDVWNAYEWNYHRTARIIMHEQLLTCLHRASSHSASTQTQGDSPDVALLEPYEAESTVIIRSLAAKLLATVPQSFGEIDHTGKVLSRSAEAPRCRGIGAYLLLWPIKIIKSPQSSVTEEQRQAAQDVFERIREYTGMKSQLGDLSVI